jgi:hypothetical protein
MFEASRLDPVPVEGCLNVAVDNHLRADGWHLCKSSWVISIRLVLPPVVHVPQAVYGLGRFECRIRSFSNIRDVHYFVEVEVEFYCIE